MKLSQILKKLETERQEREARKAARRSSAMTKEERKAKERQLHLSILSEYKDVLEEDEKFCDIIADLLEGVSHVLKDNMAVRIRTLLVAIVYKLAPLPPQDAKLVVRELTGSKSEPVNRQYKLLLKREEKFRLAEDEETHKLDIIRIVQF